MTSYGMVAHLFPYHLVSHTIDTDGGLLVKEDYQLKITDTLNLSDCGTMTLHRIRHDFTCSRRGINVCVL